MNNLYNVKKVSKLIIILTIIGMAILSLIIVIILIQKNKEDKQIQEEISGWADESIDYNNVTTEETYSYEIINCIQTYLDTLNTNNSAYFRIGENNNYEKVVDEQKIKQNICDLLSEKYITENNITLDNVYTYTGQINERLLFVPIKMKVLFGENADKYLAYGFLIDENYYKKKDIYIYVNKDTKNKTFSIELINKEYSDMNQIKIKNENKSIQENNNNVYNIPLINASYIAQNYFNTYKRIMLADTKLAYEYLNEEYKNKRFGDHEEFEKYVNENREELRNTGITKYQVNNEGIYSGYICLDSKDNYYIFKEKGLGQFEVILDTYTIDSDKFLKEYNNGNESKKVQLNIDKFIQMINAKDYKNSYALLYDAFKNNYFQTEEAYKQYIKNNLFEYNTVTYDKFSNEGDTYIYELTVSDKTENSTDTKKLTIIMKLKEETNFVMSFSIE